MDGILVIGAFVTLMLLVLSVTIIVKLQKYKKIEAEYYFEQTLIWGFTVIATAYILFSIIRHLILY